MPIDYTGPSFYKFSEDSILLAKFVSDLLKKNSLVKSNLSCLELGSGSGVVAIELINNLKCKHFSFDLCEAQEDFIPHINNNLKNMLYNPKLISQFSIKHCYFRDLLNETTKYDLIISNPPYFLKNQGRLSPNTKKNNCRFFLLDPIEVFFECLVKKLNEQGRAFFLGRFELNVIKKIIKNPNITVKEALTHSKMNIYELTLIYNFSSPT